MALLVKNLPVNAGDVKDAGSIPGSGRSPGEGRGRQLTPIYLPGESQGQRSPIGALQSIGLQRVGHNSYGLTHTHRKNLT